MAFGTNWTVTGRADQAALRTAGPERVLGLVTPRELGGASTADQRHGARRPASAGRGA